MSRAPRLGLIAYEYPPLIGGMATYAQALTRHMLAAGYDVHVFANRDASPIAGDAASGRSPADTGGPSVHPILTTDLARDLPGLLGQRMDCWHAINFGYAPLAILRRPFVLTVHGTDFLTPWVGWTMDRLPLMWRLAGCAATPWMRRRLATPGLRCVDRVLTCSRFSADTFARHYPAAPPALVVPNGVDDRFFRVAGVEHRHPRRLLTVGNLDSANLRKNVDGLIRAMALVGERLDLECLVVGDGCERASLERLAADLGVSRRVRFTGRLSDAALIEAYASCSLFVLVPRPRPPDIEGFGIVYLEAAAAGTPSLAGRHGGAGDAIAEGVSGFFAADHTPQAIAVALDRFFTGKVRFDAARVRAHAQRHRWSRVLDAVDRVYRSLLPAHRVGRLAALERVDEPERCAEAAPEGSRIAMRRSRPESWRDWLNADLPESKRSRRRVLLISYLFPPTGGSGVQRAAKLCKHLSRVGWDVAVLTAGHDRFPWHDGTLLADLPPSCDVYRVAGLEPACVAERLTRWCDRFTNLPDPRWLEDRIHWRLCGVTRRLGLGDGEPLWIGAAVRAAQRLHRQEPFDAVITTGPPHFVHRVGRTISAATGLPWFADLRDPLVSDFDRAPASTRHASEMRRLEGQILHRARGVITTCDALRDDLRSRYPRRATAIHTVFNGFDRDDLRAAMAADHEVEDDGSPGCIVPGDPDTCTFVASGSFYGRREIARLVEPIERLLRDHPEWGGRIRLIITGTLDAEQQRIWQSRPDWLIFTGYLSHHQAVRLAAEADCTITIIPACRHGDLSIPGKTFELLALEPHLLALVPPEGETAVIARAAGNATVAPFEDTGAVTAAMQRIVARRFAGSLARDREWRQVDRFDRGFQAARLATIVEALCRNAPVPDDLGGTTGGDNTEPAPIDVSVTCRLTSGASASTGADRHRAQEVTR